MGTFLLPKKIVNSAMWYVVMQPGYQCMLCHLVAQFTTDASGAYFWPNLQSVHVAPPGGQN